MKLAVTTQALQKSAPAQPQERHADCKGDLDIALHSVLQQHFVGDDKAEVKRLAAEAAMQAKLCCGNRGAVSTGDLNNIFKAAGEKAEQFGVVLAQESAVFTRRRKGDNQVQVQPAFQHQILVQMAEFLRSNLQQQKVAPSPPTKHMMAMESWRAKLRESGDKEFQSNPQRITAQRSTREKDATAVLKALLQAASEASTSLPPSIVWCDSSGSPDHELMLDHLSRCPSVAIDCEWAADGLCLVQIHAPCITLPLLPPSQPGVASSTSISVTYPASTYLLDVQQAPELITSLKSMFSNPSTLKVFHDCRKDVARLHEACKVRIAPVLDTQVAHALMHNAHLGSSLTLDGPGSVPRVGLKTLLEEHGIQHQFKKDIVKKFKADPDRRQWQTRPLPKEWMVYAADDVVHLLTIAQRMGAQANHLARQLSQYQADTQQGGIQGKPPPFVELQLKMGPGFSPTYHPNAKDAQPQAASSNPSEFASASKDHRAESGMDEEAASVIGLLPSRLQEEVNQVLQEQGSSGTPGSTLTEIHIDEGRPVKLRFRDRPAKLLPVKVPVAEALSHLVGVKEQFYIAQDNVLEGTDSVRGVGSLVEGPYDLDFGLVEGSSTSTSTSTSSTSSNSTTKRMGARRLFGSDGRMALPGMLHRVSGMRDSEGNVYALTYRVGRHQPGLAEIFSDLLARMCARRGLQLDGMHSDWDNEVQDQGKGPPINSILIMGPPGCGKTTLLRDMARLLSMELQQEVNVVDTSSEIAGDSFVPHPCIGNARRFFVPDRRQQHQILLESVQNHGPEVVIVDEIGTEQEVAAVSTISQRGVNMIGTAHAHNLQSLMQNPVLIKLVGGIQSVVIGDEAAKKSKGDKVCLERRGPPVFSTLIEMLSQDTWRIHTNVAESVDIALAQGKKLPNTQVRRWSDSTALVKFESQQAAQQAFGKMADSQ